MRRHQHLENPQCHHALKSIGGHNEISKWSDECNATVGFKFVNAAHFNVPTQNMAQIGNSSGFQATKEFNIFVYMKTRSDISWFCVELGKFMMPTKICFNPFRNHEDNWWQRILSMYNHASNMHKCHIPHHTRWVWFHMFISILCSHAMWSFKNHEAIIHEDQHMLCINTMPIQLHDG